MEIVGLILALLVGVGCLFGIMSVSEATGEAIRDFLDTLASLLLPALNSTLGWALLAAPFIIPLAALYIAYSRSNRTDLLVFGALYGLAMMFIITMLGLHFQLYQLWSGFTSSWLSDITGGLKAGLCWALGVMGRALDKALEANIKLSTRLRSWLKKKLGGR